MQLTILASMETALNFALVVTSRVDAPDGLPLVVDSRGPPTAPAVLFAHGFGQSRHAWTRAAQSLAQHGWRSVAFDARGHGDSGWQAGGHYRMESFVADLLAVTRSLPAPPVLVGASMGGLLGLAAAGEIRPAPFRALVLVDITPRWNPAGVERMLAFMQGHPQGFDSLAAAAEAVAAYLPQRRARKHESELAQLLRPGSDGRLRWHWDPALLDSVAREGQAHQQRLLAAARRVDVPLLLLSGTHSDVVTDVGIQEFLRAVPQARHVCIAGATHTLAGDDNTAFTAAVEDFLHSLNVEPDAAPRSNARGMRGSP